MSDFSDRDPFELFQEWLNEAGDSEINDPNAVALATADAQGRPSVRMVLLKGFDRDGFVFYTNLESRKGSQLAENAAAALLFHWKSLRRQVRVEGAVTPVSAEEADAYFASRARGSQIGAWASAQSRPLESRYALEKKVAKIGAKYGISKVPRPPHWSGFRVAPERIEFWQDGAFRLHDRFLFTPTGEDGAKQQESWHVARLYP
jgi:pyridoxamine 5'-phosphate oxidase